MQGYLDGVQELTGASFLTASGGIAVGARDAVVRFDNVTVTAMP